MQSRYLALAALCATLLLAGQPSSAKELYKWTDENGVVQYTDTKPTGVEFESREVSEGPKAASTVDATADAGSGEAEDSAANPAPKRFAADSPECEQTRQAVLILRGVGVVTLDTDGDGTQETLTDEQKQASIKQYEDWAKRNCEA